MDLFDSPGLPRNQNLAKSFFTACTLCSSKSEPISVNQDVKEHMDYLKHIGKCNFLHTSLQHGY